MTEYKFTQDWFSWAPEIWEKLIPLLPARKAFLEIGAFEGRGTAWTVENMLEDGGFIDCIDTWQGGEEHSQINMEEVEKNFDHNRELLQNKFPDRTIGKLKGTSVAMLAATLCLDTKPQYDFIYVDGSHIAKDVLTDACMAWQLLKTGGIMVFDDYMWGQPRDVLHRPEIAVNAFNLIFGEEAQKVYIGYQAVVQKKGR